MGIVCGGVSGSWGFSVLAGCWLLLFSVAVVADAITAEVVASRGRLAAVATLFLPMRLLICNIGFWLLL